MKESTRPEVEQKMMPNGTAPQEPCRDASVIQDFLDNLTSRPALPPAPLQTETESPVSGFENDFTQAAASVFTSRPDSYVDASNLVASIMWSPPQRPALSNGSTLTQGSVSSLGCGFSGTRPV